MVRFRPQPVPPATLGDKYRAAYAAGVRVVGFDNERGKGDLAVRELARRVGRDVKRVHEDVTALADLGLVERTGTGGVVCPFASIHIDMHLRVAA